METSNIVYLQRIEEARAKRRAAGQLREQPWRRVQQRRLCRDTAPRFQPSGRFATLLDYLPAEAEA